MQRLATLRDAIRRIRHSVRDAVDTSHRDRAVGPAVDELAVATRSSGAPTVSRGPRRLDLRAFLATDFAGRIRLAQGLAETRLFSDQLAGIWSQVVDCIAAAEDPAIAAGARARRIQRELIQLDPPSRVCKAALEAYLDGDRVPVAQPPPIVYLVISCLAYLAKSKRLHAHISETLDPAYIVIGDPTLSEASFDGSYLRVPAPDTYEALPYKVFEALVAVRRAHGRIGVMKIDDDCGASAPPDPEAIVRALSGLDYAGRPTGHANFDRCWHIGKAADLHVPCSRKFRGKWAKGALYYLGPNALEILVRDYLCFPTELAGEIYEDKLVGEMLRDRGIEPTRVDLTELFGFTAGDDAKPELPPFVVD